MIRDKDNGVSVVLPVSEVEPEVLQSALESMCEQSHENLEVLLVLNGSDRATRQAAHELAAGDRRTRVLELEHASLAAAINLGLKQASHTLVARMDADDWSHPQRIEQQYERMIDNPSLAALGTAYEIVGPDGQRYGVMTPPTDPAEARWRLLISNPFAHGSMMLRRDAVLALGGYDERFERAQDYELWVRLSGRGARSGVCATSEVLYTLTRSEAQGAFGATPMQAEFAAKVMTQAWNGLAQGDAMSLESIIAQIARRSQATEARGALEMRLREQGPTSSDLLAWLWTAWTAPASSARAFDIARGSRVREVARSMQASGVDAISLWGAGTHTAWLLDHQADLGISIIGIVDDALHGSKRFGRPIDHQDALKPGSHVLLSSDWHEDALWSASARARARGVHVWRLYGEPQSSIPIAKTNRRSA